VVSLTPLLRLPLQTLILAGPIFAGRVRTTFIVGDRRDFRALLTTRRTVVLTTGELKLADGVDVAVDASDVG
jgi:hypothetical protein